MVDAVALANIAAGIVVSHFGVTSVSGPELRDEFDPSLPLDQGKMTAEQLKGGLKSRDLEVSVSSLPTVVLIFCTPAMLITYRRHVKKETAL